MRRELLHVADTIAELDPGPGESRELMRYDLTVHRLIYQAAANPHLEDTLIRYDNLATRIWCLVLDKVPSVSGHIVEHVELLDGDCRRRRGPRGRTRPAPRGQLRGIHPQGSLEPGTPGLSGRAAMPCRGAFSH